MRWSREDGELRRREALGRRVVELVITSARDTLRVTASPVSRSRQSLTSAESAALEKRIRRMFQLDLDLTGFFELSRGSAVHAWVEPSGFGRLLCGTTLWEDAVKIIATTNTTWRQTMRMVELLVAVCGREGAFPEPEDVLRFGEAELQERCRLGYRARSVHSLARGIASGELDLEAIAGPSQTTAELFASYRKLPGIGPYGAAHLLAMDGRHDFIAVDSEFRRFVRETYHGGRKVSDKAMVRRYAKWGHWKYLAYWSELWGSVADRLQPLPEEDN